MPVTTDSGVPWTRKHYDAALQHLGRDLPDEQRDKLRRKVQQYETDRQTGQSSDTIGRSSLDVFEEKAGGVERAPDEKGVLRPAVVKPMPGKVDGKDVERKMLVPDYGWAEEGAALPEGAAVPPPVAATPKPNFQRDPEVIGQGGFWDNIPSHLGGNMVLWSEPPIDEFRRDMGPVLSSKGIDVTKLDESSPQYAEYSDRRWMVDHDAAEATGKPLTRVSKLKGSLYNDAVRLNAEITSKVSAFGMGYLDGLSAQLGSETLGAVTGTTEAIRETTEGGSFYPETYAVPSNRSVNIAGNVLGSVNPVGLGARFARYMYGKLAGEAPGIIRAGIAAGTAAGTTAAGEGLASDTARAVGDVSRGAPVEGMSGEEQISRGLKRFGYGFIPGFVGGVGAKALDVGINKPFEENTPGMLEFRQLGGETSFGRGVKLPEYAKENVSEALTRRRDVTSGSKAGDAIDVAVEKTRGPYADAAAERNTSRIERHAAENRRYYDATPGVEVEPSNLLTEISTIVKSRSYPDGGDLALANNEPFLKAAGKMVKGDLIEAGKAPPGASKLSVDEARQLGIEFEDFGKLGADDVTDISGPAPMRAGLDARSPAAPGLPESAYVVVLKPRKMSAETMDQQLELIDNAAKAGKKAEADPAYKRFMAAARRDRDKFPPVEGIASKDQGGWSGLKERHGREASADEQTFTEGGIQRPVPYESMSGSEQQTLHSALRNYRSASSGQLQNEAAMRIAGNGEVRRLLNETFGTRLAVEMDEATKAAAPRATLGPGGLNIYAGGFLQGARTRLDQPLRALAGEIPEPLKGILKQMRQGVSPGQGLWGLGGGSLGRKVSSGLQATEADSGELNDEDFANLQRLLDAYQKQEKRP